MPVVQHSRPPRPEAADKVRAVQPGSCSEPNSLREAAFEEKVPSRFRGASAYLTRRLMRPSSFGKTVSSPEAVLYRKPREETAFWWGPSLTNDVTKGARQSRQKLGFVCRAGRTAPIGSQRPNYGVLRAWRKLNSRKEIPKANVLLHMIDGESLDRDVSHPVVTFKGVSDSSIFPF